MRTEPGAGSCQRKGVLFVNVRGRLLDCSAFERTDESRLCRACRRNLSGHGGLPAAVLCGSRRSHGFDVDCRQQGAVAAGGTTQFMIALAGLVCIGG